MSSLYGIYVLNLPYINLSTNFLHMLSTDSILTIQRLRFHIHS